MLMYPMMVFCHGFSNRLSMLKNIVYPHFGQTKVRKRILPVISISLDVNTLDSRFTAFMGPLTGPSYPQLIHGLLTESVEQIRST